MSGLESTIGRLIASRRRWETLMTGHAGAEEAGDRRLMEVPEFGANPGALRMLAHLPKGLPAGAPLVVVLHGCTQTAASYDQGAGWSALADRHGFALLFPEQQRANNGNLCFNWYQPEDLAPRDGELASIRQMITWMLDTLHLDRRRVFVTGLSAGGAMTAALLAAYPDLFAAGAILAGLPTGCATTVQDALDLMFHGTELAAPALGARVRAASTHRGPWPHVSVWQGTADTVVVPANAAALVRQWRDVHGLAEAPSDETVLEGCRHRVWRGRDGAPLLTAWDVPGMGHGTPLDTARCGKAMPHMLDVGVASTLHIARAWGLLRSDEPPPTGRRPRPAEPVSPLARLLRTVGLAGDV